MPRPTSTRRQVTIGLFDEALVGGSFVDEPTPTDPADTTDGLDDGDSRRRCHRRAHDVLLRLPAGAPGGRAVASASQLEAAIDPVLRFRRATSRAQRSPSTDVSVSQTNADAPVIPASNQKLFVALAALDVLGPDHRFTTSVAVPPAQDGEVDGDIYLIGGGDPCSPVTTSRSTERRRQPVRERRPVLRHALADADLVVRASPGSAAP